MKKEKVVGETHIYLSPGILVAIILSSVSITIEDKGWLTVLTPLFVIIGYILTFKSLKEVLLTNKVFLIIFVVLSITLTAVLYLTIYQGNVHILISSKTFFLINTLCLGASVHIFYNKNKLIELGWKVVK